MLRVRKLAPYLAIGVLILLSGAGGAAIYCLVRGVEAYGLYKDMSWAELLAAGSAAIYVPLEIVGLYRHRTWLGLALLLANVAVVAIMVQALSRKRALRRGDERRII